MPEKLPAIIVTGASGIVGKGFLEATKDHYLVYAIARRSQKEAGIPQHPNIKWIQVDIANWISLRWVMHNIKRRGGVDYIIHLAAYYDFEYTDNPEYDRTNVKGTRYLLEQAKILRVKRFIFASSTAACSFPQAGETINEKTILDAEYTYAETKKKGEDMVQEFSAWFPCSIVRFAAVFTDWCEYGVLYMFLSTWLSSKWNARVLGGKGESAVSYIHARDLNKLILTILKKSTTLPQFDTYIASPDGSTSHKELFETATRFYFGKTINPIGIPKFLALPGVIFRDILGRIFGKRPFERPWMIKYLDDKLDVDAAYTRESLNWQPTPRYHILRRLLFLIEKMKHEPGEWHRKNRTALTRVSVRPNLLIYEAMMKLQDEIVEEIRKTLLAPEKQSLLPHYRSMEEKSLHLYLEIMYQLIGSSVRNNDRMLLLDYVRDLANLRFSEGFNLEELSLVLFTIGEKISERLKTEPHLKSIEQLIHDNITITTRMVVDEVEDAFEQFETKSIISQKSKISEIEGKINEMETFYKVPTKS